MEDLSKFVPNVIFEQIPIKNLVSSQDYQRTLSMRHVKKAVNNFDLYQINPVKMVYVSTGGTPTEGQMRGLLSVTPNARHYLGFDKDDAGRQFVANFRKVAAEMGFRHEHVQAYHPLGCYKDWNDALLNKKSAELIAKGEPDTFDYAEFIAAGKAEKQREKEEKNTYHRSV